MHFFANQNLYDKIKIARFFIACGDQIIFQFSATSNYIYNSSRSLSVSVALTAIAQAK